MTSRQPRPKRQTRSYESKWEIWWNRPNGKNFIHPAIYLREYCGERVTSKELAVSFQILDIACSYLSKRLDEISRVTQMAQIYRRYTRPQLLGA